MIIEAELEPTDNVENEAQERLKSRLKDQSLPVESVIALIYPETLRQTTNLKSELAKARLRYRVLYANENPFPEHGWLEGSISDLADLIHLIAIHKSAFDQTASDFRKAIDSAVSCLQSLSNYPLIEQLFGLLGLAEVLKTKDPFEEERLKLKKTGKPPALPAFTDTFSPSINLAAALRTTLNKTL